MKNNNEKCFRIIKTLEVEQKSFSPKKFKQ